MVYHAADRTFMKERWTIIRRKDLQQSKNKTEKETIKKMDTNITNLREIFFLILEMSHEGMCLFNEDESRIYKHSHLWIFSGGAFHDELAIGFLEDSSATCYLALFSGCSLSVDSGLHGGRGRTPRSATRWWPHYHFGLVVWSQSDVSGIDCIIKLIICRMLDFRLFN